jgi:hypothetical protein
MRADKIHLKEMNSACSKMYSECLAQVRENKAQPNHQDHVVTTDVLTLETILRATIEESGSTNHERKRLAKIANHGQTVHQWPTERHRNSDRL